MLALTIATYFC